MPQLLYAAAFALEDRELLADFSCGDEPWSLAAAEWIQGGGVEKSVTQHGTQVWLFRRDSDNQLIRFGSLGQTRRRWPPPTGPHINLLIIPQLAVDIRFHGQPADDPPRYSHQILGHLSHPVPAGDAIRLRRPLDTWCNPGGNWHRQSPLRRRHPTRIRRCCFRPYRSKGLYVHRTKG
jgi:hypothetical protein